MIHRIAEKAKETFRGEAFRNNLQTLTQQSSEEVIAASAATEYYKGRSLSWESTVPRNLTAASETHFDPQSSKLLPPLVLRRRRHFFVLFSAETVLFPRSPLAGPGSRDCVLAAGEAGNSSSYCYIRKAERKGFLQIQEDDR